METYYGLYLKLYSLSGCGDSQAFSEALALATKGVSDPAIAAEVFAISAIAVTDFEGESLGGDFISQPLLDFYEFQQVWQRYRNLAPRQ